MPRFIFSTLTVLTFAAMLEGCPKSSDGKPRGDLGSGRTTRWKREVDGPLVAAEIKLGIPRPRNTKVALKDTQVEEVFRKIDANSDGMVDAAEWVNFSKETSIRDFVELLDYADVNDDEAFSLKEFLSVQVVKIDQSEDERDDVDVTS